jgi:nucleolar protein 14
MGQSLAQIERFERIEASDDEEDEEQGRLNAKMVSENFFGGFDDNADSAQAQQENKKKSRKEWIDEMIAKSKQLKYERQKEKDKTLELTDKLDKEWRNLIPIINPSLKKNQTAEEEDNVKQKPKPDDYDVLVRSLQFESIKAQVIPLDFKFPAFV